MVAGRNPFNLLVITLDTTRADHLGSYGCGRIDTSNLDRLAAEGVRYDSVTAPVPLTLPSHASLFTGQYPFTHGVRDNVNYRLDPSASSLAEVLVGAGYHTGGFIGAYVLSDTTGINQGFEAYTDFRALGIAERTAGTPTERPGSEVVAEALDWMETQSGNFFAWVHLFDPHLPYAAPSPYRERHPDRPYDAEIAYVDALVGELLAGLEKSGKADNTLVVVTADHGEGLGEHGETRHGALVYDATVRVPLLMWAPRVLPARTVIDTPVSLVDVLPTVLGILDIDDPVADSRDGRDTRALMIGGDDDPRTVYAESLYPRLEYGIRAQRALRSGVHKYIAAAEAELYDTAADPQETRNVADNNPEVVARLEAEMEALIAEDDPTQGFAATAGAAAAHLSRLRGLGYIGAGAPADVERILDARATVAITEAFEDGVAAVAGLLDEERWDEAVAALDEMAALGINERVVLYYRGHLALQRGDVAAAIAELEAAIEEDAAYTLPYMDLANAYWLAGDRGRAFAFLEETIETFPETATFRVLLATYLHEAGEFDRALPVYREARQLQPREPILLANLALLHLSRRETALARELIEQLTDVTPRDPEAWSRLAMILAEMGDYEGAVRALQRSLELNPDQPGARYGLGMLLVQQAGQEFQGVGDTDSSALQAKQAFDQLIRAGFLRIR